MRKFNLFLMAILFSSLAFANEGTGQDQGTSPDDVQDDIKIEFRTACLIQGVFEDNLPIRVKLSSYYREWTRKELIQNISLEECENHAIELANIDGGITDHKYNIVYKAVSARMWFKDFESGTLIEDEISRGTYK